ncbi:DUF5324 family protein [Streptomyces sannanensis]
MDSMRAATGTAKESVLHAAEVVAPYADTARDQAAHYAHEARVRLAPKVSKAARQARCQARVQYDARIAPHVPPKVDKAAHQAAGAARKAARQATDYTVPRMEHAVAVTQPMAGAAMARSAAAVAALRGQITVEEIAKLARRNERRARARRAAKGVVLISLLAGAAYAAWRWWDKQANPDWLVEPPAATEISSVDRAVLDPEVQAKQAKSEAAEDEDQP